MTSRRRKIYDLTIDRARGRARRAAVALIGGLIVLFNILAAGALGASAHAAAPMLGDLSGDRIVICTGAGMILTDRDGQPVEPKSDGAETLCPFCLPLMQGQAKTPDPAAPPPVPVVRVIVPGRSDQLTSHETRTVRCAARPRAPPVS